MRTVLIDSYLCSGCATCTEMCPEVFALNPLTGKTELIAADQEVTGAVCQVAAYCPEKCIIIGDDEEAPL